MNPLVAMHIFVDAAKHLYRCVANFKNCSAKAPTQFHCERVNITVSLYRGSNKVEVIVSRKILLKVPPSMIPSPQAQISFIIVVHN
jgi:hypothetical protein